MTVFTLRSLLANIFASIELMFFSSKFLPISFRKKARELTVIYKYCKLSFTLKNIVPCQFLVYTFIQYMSVVPVSWVQTQQVFQPVLHLRRTLLKKIFKFLTYYFLITSSGHPYTITNPYNSEQLPLHLRICALFL